MQHPAMLAGLLLASLLAACAGQPRHAAPSGSVPMTFVYLETGPNSATHTPEQKQEIFRGHMGNMQRLADEKTLLIAGPFGQPRNPTWRGIFVFDIADVAQAREIAETDPGVVSGELKTTIRPIAAPPASREMPRLEQAMQAELKAAGQPERKAGEPPPGLRRYVMMHAENFAKAHAALRGQNSPRVLWAAAFRDGTDGVFILDATDPDAASAAMKALNVGPHVLDRWMSTKSVERMLGDARDPS